MEFYQGKRNPNEVREYDGMLYNYYDTNDSSYVSVWNCKPSTMKNWGRKISEEQARTLIPNLDLLRTKAQHGREWAERRSFSVSGMYWTEEAESREKKEKEEFAKFVEELEIKAKTKEGVG